MKIRNVSWKRPSSLILLLWVITLSLFAACSNNPASNSASNGGNSGSNASANRKATGASAHDFLAANPYSKLLIEIQYAKGYEPTQEAIDSLISFLDRRLHKPDGIQVIKESIADPGMSPYTIDQVDSLEQKNRTQFNSGSTIAAYMLFLDGSSSEDTQNGQILGEAYLNTSMVFYEKSIMNNSGGFGQPSRAILEATVMRHEFGHNLGLVNLGTSMVVDHEDTSHPHHCDNKNCLMYWSVNTSNFVGNLAGGAIPQLDQNCLDDLQANGGK